MRQYARRAERQSLEVTCVCFFFNDTATTEIYPLSLHDALPISTQVVISRQAGPGHSALPRLPHNEDRKSTRLNSSHRCIPYAVFCLKKKEHSGAGSDPERRRGPLGAFPALARADMHR